MNEQKILYQISLISKRKTERLIVIDIDVAVQRRRDFALNRHYISVAVLGGFPLAHKL